MRVNKVGACAIYQNVYVLAQQMQLFYPVLIGALAADRKHKISRLISNAFDKTFAAETLQGFNKAVLCQQNGDIIGVACVRESSAHPLPTLECVCVAAQHRRQGIAHEMIACAQTDLGYNTLMLHIDKDNQQLQKVQSLYRDCGFVVTRESDTELEMQWRRQNTNNPAVQISI